MAAAAAATSVPEPHSACLLWILACIAVCCRAQTRAVIDVGHRAAASGSRLLDPRLSTLSRPMNLTPLDWTVIAVYFLFNLGIGLYYARRARGSTSEFFLSGRDVPWWLAGTSMVATTFAADTPLLVTGLVAKNGIAGNWLWWNMVMSGMMTVFFYARLWRRAGVMTDIEFAELRYSGKPAAFLRGFRALYLGIPINCIILGWVNLAMIKILHETLQFDQLATAPPGPVSSTSNLQSKRRFRC